LARADLAFSHDIHEELKDIVADELNVKKVDFRVVKDSGAGASGSIEIDTRLTPELKREGMAREVIRNVQSTRKQANLEVDDRIELSLSTTDEVLRQAIEEHADTIKAETLANQLVFDHTLAFESSCAVDDAPITISLQKA
jgi:isoleucyl-tRNA synthetase